MGKLYVTEGVNWSFIRTSYVKSYLLFRGFSNRFRTRQLISVSKTRYVLVRILNFKVTKFLRINFDIFDTLMAYGSDIQVCLDKLKIHLQCYFKTFFHSRDLVL